MINVDTSLPKDPVVKTDAENIVSRFTKYAAVGGLVPVPVLDMAAVAGVQLKMLESLSSHYGIPFRENLGKQVIGTIIGAGASYNLGSAVLMAFNQYIRFVPVAGQIFGLAVMPAVAAGATNVLGKIFIRHFESGGNLFDLNVEEARKNFRTDFGRRKAAAEPVQSELITPAT